jgi:hypothetical protein
LSIRQKKLIYRKGSKVMLLRSIVKSVILGNPEIKKTYPSTMNYETSSSSSEVCSYTTGVAGKFPFSSGSPPHCMEGVVISEVA